MAAYEHYFMENNNKSRRSYVLIIYLFRTFIQFLAIVELKIQINQSIESKNNRMI